MSAQRRPELPPRRHPLPPVVRSTACALRSTKAGASTPATPDHTGEGNSPGEIAAQRRPGLPPRRHFRIGLTADQMFDAQRRPGLPPRRHPRSRDPTLWRAGPLNEGRGFHPGDTRIVSSLSGCFGARSTKAGASTPATRASRLPLRPRSCALNEGRGFHPGDTRPSFAPCCPPSALNEGRGFHPGDTCRIARIPNSSNHAQRRPGLPPRRHLTAGYVHTLFYNAQRRPGLPPRRHSFDVRYSDAVLHAQRRPGLPPRRHVRSVARLAPG